MTKTSSDFRAAASKALEALADALLPRLRPIMDELGAVRTAGQGMVQACSDWHPWQPDVDST